MDLNFARPSLRGETGQPVADYLPVSWGQAHRLQNGIAECAAKPPLYCLHGTAYSGRSFLPLMAQIKDRRVAALDTPGYGGSTRPSEPWPLERYAEAVAEAIDAAGDSRVDLFGYHTGAFIALCIAAARPELVRRLVLIGPPYFPDPTERETWRRKLAAPMHLTDELEQLHERWNFLVRNRAQGVGLEVGFGHFVDELRAYPHGYWAHQAAFAFEADDTLAKIGQPTLVLNPDNHLSEASRQAAARIANAQVVDLPDLSHGVLDVAPQSLAAQIGPFLDGGEVDPA